MPTDLRAIARLLGTARATPARGIVAAVLPASHVAAISDGQTLLRSALAIHPRARLFVESRGSLRAVALVFVARRPEWLILLLAARPDPDGSDGAFRLLSALAAAAARAGAQRLYGAAPDEPVARETFFQAGFYSYTTEAWYAARLASVSAASPDRRLRAALGRDAHDLFRLYAHTTPHAVLRAEDLSVPDFDLDRDAAALAPPHLVDGNPLGMRRERVLVVGDDTGLKGVFVGFRGRGPHPHVCTLRSVGGDVDLARDLLRAGAVGLDGQRSLMCPVRPYEEHVARALEGEGFREVGAAMLFVKELAVRVEERALAPAVVR